MARLGVAVIALPAALAHGCPALCAAGDARPEANCPALLRNRREASAKRTSTDVKAAASKVYTTAEVAKHATKEDCWLMIKGKVYDVTGWGADHPGGEVIYTYGGQDATDVFSAFHGQSTWLTLRERLVGTCIDAEEEGIVKDFRELRARMQQDRMFDSSPLYYVWKCSSNLAILAASLLLIAHNKSYPAVLFSATLLGLFWQQSGWLAHDFLHHQVFKSRALNNIAGLIIGNVWQGFSVGWWKHKHNTHHAVPNKLDDGQLALDPDIDTLPLLAWSADMIPNLEHTGGRALVRWQHLLFVPILLVARVSWCLQSITFSLGRAGKGQKEVAYVLWERLGLAAHYSWYLAAAFALLPVPKALVFLLASQLASGLLLSGVFIVSHNGMEVYNDGRNFVLAQLAATRNIDRGLFNDWFTGGLNTQIEHHLFPTLPRHNLRKAQKLVRELCSKHGVYYEECSLHHGVARVVTRLREVALLA